MDTNDDSSGSAAGRKAPRKLRKRHVPPSAEKGDEDTNLEDEEDEEMTRRFSPVKRTSLPILPPIFTRRRSSFNPFSTPRDYGSSAARQQQQQRLSSWIDEDTIHGPKVKKPRSSKRYSIRESWPLRAMAPTLPRLHQHQQQQAAALLTPGGQQHDLLAAGYVGIPPLPGRMLPRPPRPAVVVPRASQSVTTPPGVKSYSPQKKQGSPTKPQPAARMRNASTDSTLSQILRSTERRLQESGPSGVAVRNRMMAAGASSPTAKTYNTASVGETTPVRQAGCEPGTHQSPFSASHLDTTPSPTRSSARSWQRAAAADEIPTPPQSPVSSDPDSLLAEASSIRDEDDITMAQTALRSPSRAQNGRSTVATMRPHSPDSSVSSSLSTVYSEDETQEGTTQLTSCIPAACSRTYQARHRLAQPRTTRSCLRLQKQHRETSWTGGWALPTGPGLNRPPRLRSGTMGQENAGTPPMSLAPPNTTTALSFQDRDAPSPLADRLGGTTPTWLAEKPAVFVTSPSTAGMSTPPTIVRMLNYDGLIHADSNRAPDSPKAYPPPLNLRPRRSSPTLGNKSTAFDDGDDGDPMPLLPGSPEMALVRPLRGTKGGCGVSPGDRDSIPILHEMPGRAPSPVSSEYSEYPEEDGGGGSPSRRSLVAGGRRLLPTAAPAANRRHRPQAQEETETTTHDVGSTVAALRRMNSQISAYSTTSSQHSASSTTAAAAADPTKLRGGGCSVPAKAGSTRHYLALGNNNASSRRTSHHYSGGRSVGTVIEEDGCSSEGGEKENGGECFDLKMPRPDLTFNENTSGRPGTVYSPPRRPASGTARKTALLPWRGSEESLGLYDQDGFLISSPLRA